MHVGDTIQYTITVSNPGDLDLTNVRVTDPKLGVDYTFPTLAAGGSATIPANLTTYVAKDSDGTKIHNVATATGMSAFGPVGPVMASADVCVIRPAIKLVKSVLPTSVTVTEDKPAVPVDYTYLITNTGDTTLYDVTLVDDQLGTILGTGGSNGGAITLASGESTTVVVAGVNISKPTDNTAVTAGYDKLGKKVTDTSKAHVDVNVIKTFKLKVTSPAANADSYFVRYVVGDATADLPLASAGEGIYAATATMPWGTTIKSWQFFAKSGAHDVALGPVMGPETLKCAVTNNGEFTPGKIDGHKFVGTLTENTPKSGWTIYLYRNGSATPYMTTTTGSDGAYYFGGLLPGSYTVVELESADYTRIKPAGENLYGPFEVKSGSQFSDNDFVNQPKPARLEITKTADQECVHVGDKIQYTITVKNPGDLDLTNVRVTDPKLGLDYTFPSLVVGQSAAVPLALTTYVATEADGTKVHNVATATGTSVFGQVGPVEAHADVCVIHPDIKLVKKVDPECVTVTEDKPEAPVTYTFEITNTGDTLLTDVTLSDDQLGMILGVGGKNGPAIELASGETTTVVVKDVPISKPTVNIATVKGTDLLGKTVDDEARASVCVKVVKTFHLAVSDAVANVDEYFVRYAIGDASKDLTLTAAGGGIYTATAVVDWGTTIATWQFFALSGAEKLPLTGVLGPETLKAAKTNHGEYDPGVISGHKFVGSLTENAPREGWTIYLFRSPNTETPYMTTTTNAQGEYRFAGLLPGTYTVSERLDPDYTLLKPEGNAYGPFEVKSGSSFADNDFVNELKTQNISGHKFNDLNANGVWDLGEPGLEGWTIKLQANIEGWVDVATTVTDAAGAYSFTNVPANMTYRVVEVLQSGWTQSMPAEGFYTIEPQPGKTIADIDFGNWHNGTVYGFKFEDINENGEWDTEAVPPEVGLSGWTIEARDAEGKLVASTVTGEGGAYELSLAPGTYTLTEVLKTDDPWRQTAPSGGSFTVTVLSNGRFGPYNFGNVAPLPALPPEFTKSADKTEALPGEIVTYKLTYSNPSDLEIPGPFTIVDDYDQSYMTPVELNGGVDDGDTITWVDSEALQPGETRTITYTMRVATDVPEGITYIDNIATFRYPPDGEITGKWRVTVGNEPTPVTGLELGLLGLLAALALAGSVVLRVAARKA